MRRPTAAEASEGHRAMTTFRQFIAQRATWLDKARCRLFGHPKPEPRRWHPMDEAEDRTLGEHPFCSRCGEWVSS